MKFSIFVLLIMMARAITFVVLKITWTYVILKIKCDTVIIFVYSNTYPDSFSFCFFFFLLYIYLNTWKITNTDYSYTITNKPNISS